MLLLNVLRKTNDKHQPKERKMKKQISEKLDKAAKKIETIAIITFIVGGMFGFGYGAVMGIKDAFQRHSERKVAPAKQIPSDTIEYISAMKMSNAENQR